MSVNPWGSGKVKSQQHRFFEKCWRDPVTGCIEWMGSRSKGYGLFSIDGVTTRAHRWAYEFANGPIPDGLVIDHLCRNRGCQNPEHMEAVTIRENLLRGDTLTAANARRTHCPAGHPLVPPNLSRSKLRIGKRVCAECCRVKELRRYHRKRLEAAQ